MSKAAFTAYLKHPTVIAPLAVILATLFRMLLDPLLHNRGQFLIFAIAVVIAALYGGRWAGITAVILSMPVCDYLFIDPRYTLFIDDKRAELITLFLFAALGVLSSVVIHRSLSDRARLIRTLADLQASEAELEKRTKELLELNEGLKRFAYAASHDLREPLLTMGTSVELVINRTCGTMDAESSEALTSLLKAIERMKRLIRDIMEFAQAANSSQQENSAIDTYAVAQTAIANLGHAIQESGAHILLDELPRVCANDTAILRLFQNLISNAIKYRGDKTPRVNISFSERDREWVFSVQDNGIGIDPKYHSRIFEPFRRLHGQSRYEGSGLGLSVCLRIVQSLGGRIWVESRAGEGSTFFFTVPKQTDAAVELSRKPPVVEARQNSSLDDEQRTIPKVRRAANGGGSA